MDLFDLSAKITLDSSEYERGLDKASGKLSGFGSALKSGLATVAKVGGASIGAAATALGFIGKEAVSAYANFEQLVGGVETLFKDSAGVVQQYAENAYQTAGLSANQYMETVTSFSASLLQSLGGDTQAAAQTADMAITDMADNANKMGTSMEAIQNAYQGFAKQNYTMLDNLKLGYGGTKTEMERLLADAQELSGVEYNIENLSDVYEAIHVIQTELGVTGTTAKEAASTISGSFGMLKASWKNFLTGLGDKNANLGKLTDQLVQSAETLLENLEPVVTQVLESLAGAVERLGPMIGEKLPDMLMTILPSLISGAMGLVGALAEAIPEMLSQIWEAVDTAISNSGFAETWAVIKETVSQAAATIKENWDNLVAALQPLIDRVQAAWQGFIKWAQESGILQAAIEGIAAVINTVIAVIGGIAVAFDSALTAAGQAADWIKEKWQPVADFFSRIAATIEGIFAKGPGVAVGMENIDWSGMNFAIGNDYVPYNGMPAVLHRGEAVLTAREAEAWRQGESGRGNVVNLNIYAQQLTQADMDYIVATVNRELAP